MGQVLTETLLLASCGTAAGVAIAAACSRVLSTLARGIPRMGEVSLDWRVLLYTSGIAVLVSLLSGLLPAFRAGSADPAGALSQGGRAQVSGRSPARWVLVYIQVALAVCLLSGAGLLLRSFRELSQVSPGFDASHVLAFRLTGSYGETADIPKLTQSTYRTLDAIRTLPGVRAAASSLTLPGVPFKIPADIASPDSGGTPGGPDPALKMAAESRYVTDGYFATMGIPILAGEPCDRRANGAGAVVNRSFASSYFGARDPLGRHLSVVPNTFGAPARAIVGVAADAREAGINREPVPTVYWCGTVMDPDRAYLLRTAGDPASLERAVRKRIQSVEPGRAVYDLAPLPEHLNDAFAEERLRTLLLTLFAATALSLACVGLYGTMTYFVAGRRREIGLRIALGARRSEVGLRFVGQGMAVASAGAAAGFCLAAVCARFVSGMLYNVAAGDTMSLLAATGVMLSVALVAAAIPAIRAARIDPMQVLREE